MNDERHLFLGSAGRRVLLLLGVLFALLAVLVPDARAGALCCNITAIDRAKNLVTAKETATGRAFQFQVKDAALLKSLKVGQKVSADLKAMTVTLPGAKPGAKAVQLKIMKADPVAAPASPPTGATGSAATSGSGSGASKKKKTSGGGLDSLDPNSVKVTPAPEGDTAMALRGKPAHEGQPGKAGATASPPPNPAAAQVSGGALAAGFRPLKALRLSPERLAGGNTGSGTVELLQAPGPGGVTVALESSDPELAEVPSQVTVTHGTASAETGSMYIARFDITTRAVHESKSVTIRARAGVQTLEARLLIRAPHVKTASLAVPSPCDGNKKGTVTFELTGPAPSGGITFSANLSMSYSTTTASGATASGGGGPWGSHKTVPSGTRSGSMRVELGRCGYPGYQGTCHVHGSVRVVIASTYDNDGGHSIGGSCRGPD